MSSVPTWFRFDWSSSRRRAGTSLIQRAVRAGGTAARVRRYNAALAAGLLLSLASGTAQAQSWVNLRLMPMGDSITAGYQSSTGDGYRGPLYTTLQGQVGTLKFVGSQMDGTMADPDNEGHYGAKIADIAALATGVLNTYKPNIVLLHIGSNDINGNYDVADAPARLASLIDQIVAAEPDVALLVAQIIPSQYPSTEDRIVTFNAQIPAIVAARAAKGEHVAVVSMANLTPSEYADTLHPNDAGYQQMAADWDPAILKAISAGWLGSPAAGSMAHPVGNITSGLSGGCVDALNGGTGNGTVVDIAACSTAASQQWNANNGNVVFQGKCLDNTGGQTQSGNKVELWQCTGGSNQVWMNSSGRLVNPASGKCLDDPYFNTTPGTQLQLWDCNGGLNQEWHLASVGVITSGISTAGTPIPGLCLNDSGGSTANLNPIDVMACSTTASEQWQVSNEQVTFGGKCMDVTNGGTADGTPVILFQCHGGTNQVWIPTGGKLVNPVSGKCLDVPGSVAAQGTKLDIATCSNASGQTWTTPSY